jgi:uncharacterized membrane protein SirB2
MTPNFYHVLHVISLLVLTGYTFFAFAGPAPATKKKVMIITGLASLLMLVSGVGLLHTIPIPFQWQGWLIVKFVCWLAISAFAGIAYRRPGARGVLSAITVLLAGVAVYMVFYKPF